MLWSGLWLWAICTLIVVSGSIFMMFCTCVPSRLLLVSVLCAGGQVSALVSVLLFVCWWCPSALPLLSVDFRLLKVEVAWELTTANNQTSLPKQKNSSDAEFCGIGQWTLYITETFSCTLRTCFCSYAYFLDAQDALDFEWSYWIEWGREYILWLLAGHLLVSQMCRLFMDKVCMSLLHSKFVFSS